MKLFEVPMVVTSLVSLCFLPGLDAPPARADFAFGEPVSLDVVMPSFFPKLNRFVHSFSSDGMEMFGWSNQGAGQGGFDLWVLKRASPQDDWGPPENLGAIVNSASFEADSSISADGLELYFISNRPGGYGGNDMYMTRRETRTSPWDPPINLGPKVNSAYGERGSSVSPDGLELYFGSGRPGGYGNGDIWVSTRVSRSDPWETPVNLGPVVNSAYNDLFPSLSPDGLLLLFQSPRPGGLGSSDLWMTRRASHSAPWEPVVNLGPVINSPEFDCAPSLAPDGSALYFAWDYADRANIPWKAPILPIVDFNGDGQVDAPDMGLLVANWGKSNSSCDIGPFAWGDGLVDEKDLKVLMESLMTPGPKAPDVPCDVVLSWISPSLASACDVYFGTSREAVTQADRTHPQGVLVSQAQVGTTYDPEGLLDFSKTYYWRVDFVVPGPTPTIYPGPVLSFTTEAFAYPLQNLSAKASSAQPSMGPEKTVDGSGLDKSDGHSTNGTDMWLSTAVTPCWIQFEFDKIYALHELWVWNSNQPVEPFIGFGARTVTIEYAADGTTWTPLANVPEFAQAPGKPGYLHNTTVSFGGVSARYVKLTIERGWGSTPSTGLSEVRFFYIPTASALKP